MLIPRKAYELFKGGYSTDEVVRQGVLSSLGTPVSTRQAREWKKAYKEGIAEPYDESEESKRSIQVTEAGDTSVVQITTDRITSLDDLLRACDIDLSVWEVERCQINKYEIGRKETYKDLSFEKGKLTGLVSDSGKIFVEPMISVKVWLKRKPEKIFEDIIADSINRLKDYAPAYLSTYAEINSPGGPHLFSPQFYDPHFNNLSVDESHTVAKAATEFKRTADIIAAKCQKFGLPIERILLPVGNDALHADNLQGTTTKGTQQELAGDQRTAVDFMCGAYVHLTEALATVAPVDVVVVPGNHDRFVTYFLGKYLEAWFNRHPDVKVDATRGPRKYYEYGATMICMEHGDHVSPKDMPGIMATEAPEMFANTTFREVWRGHLHTEKTLFSPITQNYGVTVRYMPALAKTNEWHSLMGYVGNHRAAEGMFYHISMGPAGIFPIFVDNY